MEKKGLLLYVVTEGMKVLVVGSGKIARRKILKLISGGADITVVTKDKSEAVGSLGVKIEIGDGLEYLSKNLDRFDMIIAATNDSRLNSKISELATRQKKLVNSVTSSEECNVMFPAILDYKKFQIGITTGGSDPALSKKVKETLMRMIKPEDF
ncbi:MAG: precorrin-2 dehydrogenase/sirohydrochlorin ferrochelatase family protein [Candidatus Methanomethylicaceae archaeon]